LEFLAYQDPDDHWGEQFFIKPDGKLSGIFLQDTERKTFCNIPMKWAYLLDIFIELSYIARKFSYLDFKIQIVDYYPDVYGQFEVKDGLVKISEIEPVFSEDCHMGSYATTE
jgi:hypothetical protein